MNKALLRILCPVLMLASGLTFAFALSPARAGDHPLDYTASLSPDVRNHAEAKMAALTPTAAPVPTPEAVSQPGSTDGIVILSMAIVVIIVIPLLFQRSMWKK